MKYDIAVKSAKSAVARSDVPTPFVIYQSRNGQWMYCRKEFADENKIAYSEENVFWFHDMLNKLNWWEKKK
jgi:hypothetical protein